MNAIELLPIEKGHFRYESGHHSDSWMDSEPLCLNPEPINDLSRQLAAEKRLPLETLIQLPNEIWIPAACPMCAAGIPLSV
jgi:hypothetical protein